MSRSLIIALIIVILAGLTAIYFWLSPTTVDTVELRQSELISTLVATGFVEPRQTAHLKAATSETIRHVGVEDGDPVEADQALATLDERDARLALEQAAASLEESRARLRGLSDRQAPGAIEDLEQAQIAVEEARDEANRADALFDDGLLSEADRDRAHRQYRRAQSDLERAETTLRDTTDGGSLQQELLAGLQRALKERQRAQLLLDRHTLRAPFDGTILKRHVDPGDRASPNEPLLTLISDQAHLIRITPDERELAHLEVGQSALVAADAYPDHHLNAQLHRIAPGVDAASATLTAWLQLDDAPAWLAPDMTTTVEVTTASVDDALILPRTALRDAGTDAPFVLVIADERAVERPVDTGLHDDQSIQITDGLSPSQPVILDSDITAGQRVQPRSP